MTHLWTNYRGICLLVILVGLQAIYAVSKAESAAPERPSGIWLKSDGSTISMDCPSLDLYGDKALKLPANCVASKPGVWLSVEEHIERKAELARLSRELELTQKTLQEYRENVRSEREELASYFQRTSSELKSISQTIQNPAFSWKDATVGFATGVAMCGGIAIGGAF